MQYSTVHWITIRKIEVGITNPWVRLRKISRCNLSRQRLQQTLSETTRTASSPVSVPSAMSRRDLTTTWISIRTRPMCESTCTKASIVSFIGSFSTYCPLMTKSEGVSLCSLTQSFFTRGSPRSYSRAIGSIASWRWGKWQNLISKLSTKTFQT
jgi:hypothetical protein